MNKDEAIQFMLEKFIIGIIRADFEGDDLLRVVDAVAEGGFNCIEVTMNTPGALNCIEQAMKKYKGADVLLGVGTVLDPDMCERAVQAGARYVVTPTVDPAVIGVANRNGVPIVSGAFTATEILTAHQAGADFVKVFPCSLGGPAYIKAIRGPLNHIRLVPTNGVEANNVRQFIEAGASAVGVGGSLVTKKLLAERNYEGIARNVRAFADAVAEARG